MAEHGYKAWLSQEYVEPPHLDENTWFLPNATRAEAENLLLGMPPGTFLIRARNAGGYALSINCQGTTNHCIIHQTETGYGFSEPFNIYDSLMALVKHYSQNSLEEHNDKLTTTLRWPVNCSYILNIKEQQKRAVGSDGGGSGGKGGGTTTGGSGNTDNTGNTLKSNQQQQNAPAAVNLGLGYPTYMSK